MDHKSKIRLGWSLALDGVPDYAAPRPCGTCDWCRECAMLDGTTRRVCVCDPTEPCEVDPSRPMDCWEGCA